MRASGKHTVVVRFHHWPMWPELLVSPQESAVGFHRARPRYEVMARDVDVRGLPRVAAADDLSDLITAATLAGEDA